MTCPLWGELVLISETFVTWCCHIAVWPLHVPPPTAHAPAGVEGPPHHRLPPWPRQPRAPCPTLPPTSYYFYITVFDRRWAHAGLGPTARSWRSPDIDSGLVQAVLVRIWARSCIFPTAFWRGGTSQHPAAPTEDARAGGGRWDWVVVLSLLLAQQRLGRCGGESAFSGGFRIDARGPGAHGGRRGILTSILA